MSPIKFGCQFYTWQMSGGKYVGKLPHILKVVNAAGFAGIEPETCMLGPYYDDPHALKDDLLQHGLKLGAIALVLDWAEAGETENEWQEAERLFKYLELFPSTHLVLCQIPGKDRTDLRQRQANAIACVNAVAARAIDRGITCSFHPNSPPGSVFRNQNDYRVLLDGLDSRVVGFAPDSGHIAKGCLDVIEVFQNYNSLIKHVHFKDITASGQWTAMGAGVIDFPHIVAILRDTGYDGWIMIEEESLEAETNPDAATNKNGKYLHRVLLPIVRDGSIPEKQSLFDDTGISPESHFETIHYPAPDQVRITGRLFSRFQGNLGYLEDIYEKKRDWMLEPFQNRGMEWVIEPRRNQKGELPWAGEYAGKWLDAAALTASSSNDEQLKRYCSSFATSLVETQEPDGYLGIEAPAKRGGNSEWDLWNIKYAMTGLLAYYEAFRDKSSLDAALRCSDWLINQYGMQPDANSSFYHSAEEGGVSMMIDDDLVQLFRITGEKKYLKFAASVVTNFAPIARMRYTQSPLLAHAYNMLGYLGGAVELFSLENASNELRWVEKVWEDLVDQHLYPTGSLGYNELLRKSAPNDTPVENGQPERHHQETCATVEWLLFNARLYQVTGNVRYVQKMEQTIYNALLAAQSTDGMNWMYYTPLRYEKRWFMGPTSCCYWSGPRGIARIPVWVYAVDKEGIFVNLYESSEATIVIDGQTVVVRQISSFPDEGRVKLRLQTGVPLDFTLRLRNPFQGSGVQFKLNEMPISLEPEADGYFHIRRKWRTDDQVEMEFRLPISVRHFLSEQYGFVVRGAEVLSVNQKDNPSLELDQISLPEEMTLTSLHSAAGRRCYVGESFSDGQMVQVVFTPYADCGGEGSRFRTAFPIGRRQ